ncbi:hypothetical protein BOX15_Mlig020963g2 [Macrostomum lignano]|uniref:Uncharacterized protein n=2 Tax=Macrostomum lignano TaxID=282301 RepID=A0A267GC78_9PLAT|nr:hypothetical protein BOX15_Mlig020963g2 [Macrostomum lignano]
MDELKNYRKMMGAPGKSSKTTHNLHSSARNSRSAFARQCLFDTAMDLLKRFCAVVALSGFIELMKKYLNYSWAPFEINDLVMVRFPIETVLLVLAFDCLDMAIENRQRQAALAPETASLYIRFIILPIVRFASKCRRNLVFLACELQLVGNWTRQMSRQVMDASLGIIDVLTKLADLLKKILSAIGYVLWPLRWAVDKCLGANRRDRNRNFNNKASAAAVAKSNDNKKNGTEQSGESNGNTSLVQYNLYLVRQNDNQRDDFYDQQQLMERVRLAIGNGEQPHQSWQQQTTIEEQ